MQPKRDPADTRYWPCRVPGSTGQGFTQHRDKRDSRYHANAIGKRSRIAKAARGIIPVTDVPESFHPPESATRQAVRLKARLATLALLDRVHRDASSMDEKVLASTLASVGKLSGVESQRVDVKHSHTLIPAEQRAERAASLLAKARLALSNSSADGTPDDTVDPLLMMQPVDAQVISVETQGTVDPSA